MQITVIDALMGAGKTSYAIQYINEHPELSFIYCTPFLDEVERIKIQCYDAHFYEPTYAIGRKIDDFNNLLMSGCNIVVTHSTFANANDDTINYLQNSNYVLILDEVLNVLEDFNDVCSSVTQKVNSKDIQMLLDNNFISVDEYGRVSWTANSYLGGKYSDVERMAKNGTLIFIDNTLLVWEFPATIFKLLKETIVLTYMFDGSILKPYFQYHDISWDLKSVRKKDGKYQLTEYDDYQEDIRKCAEMIEIFDNPEYNDYKNYSLSKNWYMKTENLDPLKNHLNNYLKNIKHAKAD